MNQEQADGEETGIALINLMIQAMDSVTKLRQWFYETNGLTPVQFRALVILFEADKKGMTQSDLSRKLNVSRANVTTLIDRMEAKGYVRRSSNETDKRSLYVSITEQTANMMQTLLPKSDLFVKETFAFLSQEERAMMRRIANKVIDSMNEASAKIIDAKRKE